jgi:hypothetical protein
MTLIEKLNNNNITNHTSLMYDKFIHLTRSRNIPAVSFDFFTKHITALVPLLKHLEFPCDDQTDTEHISFMDRLNWCEEMFGNAYIWSNSIIYFENEEQLMFYCLRWSHIDAC